MSILLAIQSAVAQGMLWVIMAIGVYLTYRIMKFSDLTVDGSFAMGACISISLIIAGVNPLVTLLIAAAGGAAAGAITGLLHTKLKIEAILSSILTMIALYSINVRILGKGNVSIMREETIFTYILSRLPVLEEETTTWDFILNKIIFSRDMITILVGLFFTIIVIAGLYWFFGTEIGCAIRATGSNENMAISLGVNIDATKILGLAISNGLVAFSGALVGQSQRYADVTMGTGTIVVGLASVVIGGVLIRNKGSFAKKLSGTALGSIVYKIAIAVVLQLGLRTDDQKLLTAIMVATALGAPTISRKLKAHFNYKEAK